MKQVFVLLTALALIGCNKSSDSGNGGGNGTNGKLQTVSVLGQSNKVGVFPDGSVPAKLSQTEIDQISKSASGALKVSQAVGSLTPSPVQSGSQHTEMAQAFLQSQTAKNLLRLRDAAMDVEQFKNELRRDCTIQQSNNQPVQTGDQNNAHVTNSAWLEIAGAACPVSARTEMSMVMDMIKTGEKAFYMKGGMDFSSRVQMLDTQDQMALDFKNQSVGGRMEGQMNSDGTTVEMAANGRLTGALDTTTQAMTAEILFDLYGTQPQQQQSGTSTGWETSSAAMPQGSGSFKLAVILTANNTKMLLQVFSHSGGGKSETHIYLNGEEMQPSSGTSN